MRNGRESNDYPSDDQIKVELRQLELVDRILGLEAEVARLTLSAPSWANPRTEIIRLQDELDAVYGSTTWKIGSAALLPMRVVLGARRAKRYSSR